MDDTTVVLHNNDACSKVLAVLELLDARGIQPRRIDLRAAPPSLNELRDLVRLTGGDARALLRSGEAAYTTLGLDDPSLPIDALMDAMVAHPELIQRPIVVHRGRAVIGRPPERVLALFD